MVDVVVDVVVVDVLVVDVVVEVVVVEVVVVGGSVGMGGDLLHSKSPSHGHPIGQYV